jgi:hypothetical protein
MENEIAIKSMLQSIGSVFTSVFDKFVHVFKQMLKLWKIVIPLVLVFGALGYFLDKASLIEKEGKVIVHQNFEAANYMYEAIRDIDSKIAANDTAFLNKHQLSNIHKVEIRPIVSLNSILNSADVNTENLETVLNEVEVSASNKNESILSSEAFIARYYKHEIYIKISKNYKNDPAIALINYLNDNAFYNKLKKTNTDNLQETYDYNIQMIRQIDSLLNRATKASKISEGNVLVVQQEDSDLNNLLKTKIDLIGSNGNIRNRLLVEDKTINIINKPVFTNAKYGLLARKLFLLPTVILLLLAFGIVVTGFYRKS